MNPKPAIWRVQFKVFLPFIIRVVERIKLVSRLPRHTVVVSLLLRRKEVKSALMDGRTYISVKVDERLIPDTIPSSAPYCSQTSQVTIALLGPSSCCLSESLFPTIKKEKQT